MIKSIIENFKQFEKITHVIMKYGLKFCFIICIISVSILFTYEAIFTSPSLYYIGISLFKLSLTLGIEFIICAFVMDLISKQIN